MFKNLTEIDGKDYNCQYLTSLGSFRPKFKKQGPNHHLLNSLGIILDNYSKVDPVEKMPTNEFGAHGG